MKLNNHVQKKKKTKIEGKVSKKRRLLIKIQRILQEQLGTHPSLNEVIIHLAESYLGDLKLNDKQLKKIEVAAQSAKMSPEQILDKACDWASKFYQNRYENRPPESMGKAKDNTNPGSAYWRIDAYVKKLMQKNDKATRKQDKVYINQTFLSKHQGANRNAIKGYLEVNKEILRKHHDKHNLGPRHNVEVKVYFFRTKKG